MDRNRVIVDKIGPLSSIKQERPFYLPTSITHGGFMVCTQGSCNVVINAKSYSIHKGDLIIVFPYSIIQLLDYSQDFDCSIIGAPLNFFAQINIPNKAELFMNISSHPSISLSREETADILTYMELLLKEELSEDQLFFDQIYGSILMVMVYKIANIYKSREPNLEQSQSRSGEIYNNFIFELIDNFKLERKLEYYAQRQSITASHLSRCVKEISGKSGSELIINYMIDNIKRTLSDRSRSIAEISEEFNFSSTSTFSQYFKKYTSLSPLAFRKQLTDLPLFTPKME